jgi:undecaprenyl-diphosphatase
MSTHSGYLWSRLIHIRGLRVLMFLLVSGGIFAAIAVSINLPGLNAIDQAATHAVQHYRTGGTVLAFYTASVLGNSLTLILVCVAVAIAMLARGHRRAALLIIVTLLSLPMNALLKIWAVRPRPDADVVEVLVPQVGMSFPSGHSMGSAVVYGFLAALLWMRAEPGPGRSIGTVVLVLLPLVIGLSRIYVGAHWLSDVIAGLAAGCFLLAPLVALYKHWHRVTPEPPTA